MSPFYSNVTLCWQRYSMKLRLWWCTAPKLRDLYIPTWWGKWEQHQNVKRQKQAKKFLN